MSDMLKELWYGNIVSQENDIFNKPELRELLGYVARRRGTLEEILTDTMLPPKAEQEYNKSCKQGRINVNIH